MRVFVLLIVSLFWLKANAQEDVDSSTWELVILAEISEARTQLGAIVNLSRKDFSSMPASFDDPSRLLTKFAGFSSSNDQNNGIVYHGTPSWMSGWSLYGSEILSPNHLSSAGTTIDWKELFDQKQEAGMQFFYVEQDDCRNFSPLKSIEISHHYMSDLKA